MTQPAASDSSTTVDGSPLVVAAPRARRIGRVLGPALLLGLLLVPPPGLEPRAERLAAVLALVIVFWVTEALPLPITALLGVALAVVLGAASTDLAFAGFADPVVFLLIGSFILVEGLRVHALDQRIALALMAHPWVGDSTYRTIWATGLTAVVISAWVNNSAAAAMLYPAILAIGRVSATHAGAAGAARYRAALLLMLAYGVSLGGMVTPVGTPTNLLGLELLEDTSGVRISFFSWMLIGGTIAMILLGLLFGMLLLMCRPEARVVPGQHAAARQASRELGAWSREQCLVAAVVLATIVLWLMPGVLELAPGVSEAVADWYRGHLPESVVSLIGASVLFLLPARNGERLLHWQDAARIDWGTIILLGSGAALGRLSMDTGLAPAIGRAVLNAPGMHLTLLIVLAGIVLAVVFSELISNTAAVNLIVPILLGMVAASGGSVAIPVVAATLGASLGFMLPVATPPNALVYSSGLVPRRDMYRVGFLLDLTGVAVIWAVVLILGTWLLPSA